MSTTTTPAAEPGLALANIEPTLADIHSLIGLIGHMATSDTDPTQDELAFIETGLRRHANKLEALWQQAWEEMKAEQEAHRAELAKAQAEAAESAPGSLKQIKQVKAMLGILRAGHSAALDQIGEMGDQIAEALAEREA